MVEIDLTTAQPHGHDDDDDNDGSEVDQDSFFDRTDIASDNESIHNDDHDDYDNGRNWKFSGFNLRDSIKKQWFKLTDFAHDHLNRDALLQRLLHTLSLFTVAKKRNLLYLYTSHALSSWGDRVWKFAVPLTLAQIYPMSLAPVAMFSSAPLLFNFFLGTMIGHLVDRIPRLPIVLASLIVQNAGVALSATMIMVVILLEPANITDTGMFPFTSWYSAVLFAIGAIFASIAALGSQASSISVQRDWAVVISQYHELKLEDMNASLRRIDLISDILSPLAFSALLMIFSPLVSIATVAW